jgi:hypothetical protein
MNYIYPGVDESKFFSDNGFIFALYNAITSNVIIGYANNKKEFYDLYDTPLENNTFYDKKIQEIYNDNLDYWIYNQVYEYTTKYPDLGMKLLLYYAFHTNLVGVTFTSEKFTNKKPLVMNTDKVYAVDYWSMKEMITKETIYVKRIFTQKEMNKMSHLFFYKIIELNF